MLPLLENCLFFLYEAILSQSDFENTVISIMVMYVRCIPSVTRSTVVHVAPHIGLCLGPHVDPKANCLPSKDTLQESRNLLK